MLCYVFFFFFFSSRRRHTRLQGDWSSDVCSSDLVLFNEGWGQFDTERLVKEIGKLDPSRLVDNAAGWTDMRGGDIVDTHSYPEPGDIEPDAQRATVLGEFGGIGFRMEGHTWSSESWGYESAVNVE